MSWFMSMKADNPVFLVLGALSALLILAALYDFGGCSRTPSSSWSSSPTASPSSD